MQINFLTTNQMKYDNAKHFFDGLEGIELVRHSFDAPEIQDTSCERIAQHSAIFAAKQLGAPCVSMDAGFFIAALNGFPGPYVKYTNEWLTEEQLLRMVDADAVRDAYFIDALAIGYPDGTSEVFVRKVDGRLAIEGEYEKSEWPANSLFIPNGYDVPLGSMPYDDQKIFWGDGCWPQLVEYLAKRNAQPGSQHGATNL